MKNIKIFKQRNRKTRISRSKFRNRIRIFVLKRNNNAFVKHLIQHKFFFKECNLLQEIKNFKLNNFKNIDLMLR